jgi:hypothetical protein
MCDKVMEPFSMLGIFVVAGAVMAVYFMRPVKTSGGKKSVETPKIPKETGVERDEEKEREIDRIIRKGRV